MPFTATTALKKIAKMDKRLRIVQGGSSAGKTIAILLLLIDTAQREKGTTISIVSESLPHLKRGALRDFLTIMEEHNYFDEERYNRTDFIYTFETGSKIEFFSVENAEKVRGLRRDILFINEANNITYETFNQLSIRTNRYIYIDYNPVSEFWVHTDILPNTSLEKDFIIVTYKDNEALPSAIAKDLEARKHSKNFWQIYGLGQIADAEGRIYKNWLIIDTPPHEARLMRTGLDFGYANDPTAIVDVYYFNGGYIFDEVVYQKGLSNRNIADLLSSRDIKALVVADSAEPKSIDEISGYGVPIIGAKKGRDSIRQGIQFIQDQKVSVTSRSVNLIKEYRSYFWDTDRDGKLLNETTGQDHALDAARYAMSTLQKVQTEALAEVLSRNKRAKYDVGRA